VDRLHSLGLTAIEAERTELEDLRSEDKIGSAAYLGLQEQLDWNELTLLRDSERQIEEI
jgi:monovalent cation/hydrogen antiporter